MNEGGADEQNRRMALRLSDLLPNSGPSQGHPVDLQPRTPAANRRLPLGSLAPNAGADRALFLIMLSYRPRPWPESSLYHAK